MDYKLKKPAEHYSHTDAKDWPKPTPRAKELLAELPEDMRDFLLQASVNGVDPDDIGDDKSFVYHSNTLRALERHGLVRLVKTKKKRKELWRPTDDGRGLITRHVPLLLHRKSYLGVGADGSEDGSGYTHDPRLAMRHEQESMDRAA